MLINKECDYAFRLVRNMNNNKLVSISSIVDKEQLTLSMAYKVARKLEKGGLISSVRGNAGGYMLARSPKDITLLDVYRIMEPDTGITHCMDNHCPLNTDASYCKVHRELERIQEALYTEMSRKSFMDFI